MGFHFSNIILSVVPPTAPPSTPYFVYHFSESALMTTTAPTPTTTLAQQLPSPDGLSSDGLHRDPIDLDAGRRDVGLKLATLIKMKPSKRCRGRQSTALYPGRGAKSMQPRTTERRREKRSRASATVEEAAHQLLPPEEIKRRQLNPQVIIRPVRAAS